MTSTCEQKKKGKTTISLEPCTENYSDTTQIRIFVLTFLCPLYINRICLRRLSKDFTNTFIRVNGRHVLSRSIRYKSRCDLSQTEKTKSVRSSIHHHKVTLKLNVSPFMTHMDKRVYVRTHKRSSRNLVFVYLQIQGRDPE